MRCVFGAVIATCLSLSCFALSAFTKDESQKSAFVRVRLRAHDYSSVEYELFRARGRAYIVRRTPAYENAPIEIKLERYLEFVEELAKPAIELAEASHRKLAVCESISEIEWRFHSKAPGKRIACLNEKAGQAIRRLAGKLDIEILRHD